MRLSNKHQHAHPPVELEYVPAMQGVHTEDSAKKKKTRQVGQHFGGKAADVCSRIDTPLVCILAPRERLVIRAPLLPPSRLLPVRKMARVRGLQSHDPHQLVQTVSTLLSSDHSSSLMTSAHVIHHSFCMRSGRSHLTCRVGVRPSRAWSTGGRRRGACRRSMHTRPGPIRSVGMPKPSPLHAPAAAQLAGRSSRDQEALRSNRDGALPGTWCSAVPRIPNAHATRSSLGAGSEQRLHRKCRVDTFLIRR